MNIDATPITIYFISEKETYMIIYKDIDGDSGVSAYEIGIDFIDVQFKQAIKIYRYSYESAGKDNVEIMKALAKSGDGLNSFINKNARTLYVK